MDKIINFRAEHARRQPVHYSVHITHDGDGMHSWLEGLDPTPKSLRAVAEDLEYLAKCCRADADEKDGAVSRGAEEV